MVSKLLVAVVFIGIFESLCLDVGGILSGNTQGSVPLGINLGDGDLDLEGVCSRPGVACVNCTHAVTCVPLPGGFLRVPLQTCDDHTTCNARLGGCSTRPVPECDPASDQFNHICEQVGIFPDAFDCRKFHMCSPPADYPHGRPAEHHVAFCPRHYAYDALTAQCRIKLQHGQCNSKPLPDCLTIGQSGPHPGSPNHYYVCLSKHGKLYPQIFVCPYGYYFYNNFCNTEPLQSSGPTDNQAGTDSNNYHGNNNQLSNQGSKNEGSESLNNQKRHDKIPESFIETLTTTEVLPTEFPPDTFLADKFDLSDYKPMGDDYVPQQNSFESGETSFEFY